MAENLTVFLVFLVPLFLIQFGLMIGALVHILRHENYRCGNRVLWLVISLFVSVIGPVLYFVIGRGENGDES